MRANAVPDNLRSEVLARYVGGERVSALGNRYDITHDAIYNLAVEAGVSPPDFATPATRVQHMAELYMQGYKQREIAERFRVSQPNVAQLLHAFFSLHGSPFQRTPRYIGQGFPPA